MVKGQKINIESITSVYSTMGFRFEHYDIFKARLLACGYSEVAGV